MQKENSPVSHILISDLDLNSGTAKLEIQTKSSSDYPSYTLYCHHLNWAFHDQNGAVLEEGKVLLPTLKPGEKWDWNLNAKKSNVQAFCLKMEMFSQSGFLRSSEIIYFQNPSSPVISNVIGGNGKARVFFDKVFGAKEYFVRYAKEGSAKQFDSPKTIMSHIDLEGFENGQDYCFEVITCNDYGESKASVPDGKPLPPVIWDAFVDKGKLVIGYSSEQDDQEYTVQYGENEEHLDNTFSSNVRGMMTIDLGEWNSCAFKIKRTKEGIESQWSNTINLKTK